MSDQLLKSYQEITRLKIFENENKSLRNDRLDLLEELRKLNKENQKLQTKLINYYETSKYDEGSQNDSDYESPNNENQILRHSQLLSTSKDRSGLDLNIDKSAEFNESMLIENSKSMMINNGHKKHISLSKYLNMPSRLNETMISSDRHMSRFNKKILTEKEKEIENKNKEIEQISKRYEEKIRELNKSRNDERENYEKKLTKLGSSFKTLTRNKMSARSKNYNTINSHTHRAVTPVPTSLNVVFPEVFSHKDLWEVNDEEEDEEEGNNQELFARIKQITGQFSALQKSINWNIQESSRDWMTVSNMINTVFEDDENMHYPTTKSTWSNDLSDFEFMMSHSNKDAF